MLIIKNLIKLLYMIIFYYLTLLKPFTRSMN